MVLPLVDEHKPKCYLCHEGFEDFVKLREHQSSVHGGDLTKSQEKQERREPAPGDVTVF